MTTRYWLVAYDDMALLDKRRSRVIAGHSEKTVRAMFTHESYRNLMIHELVPWSRAKQLRQLGVTFCLALLAAILGAQAIGRFW